MTTHIIGCGGVAAHFIDPFLRTLKYCKNRRLRGSKVVLHDGDKLEDRNLQRQNFDTESVERAAYKAAALAARCLWYDALTPSPSYVDASFECDPRDLIICFVDNHTARATALNVADTFGASVISAANSTIGAEAWFYEPRWKGTGLDPRVRYPVILTDDSDNPLRPAGCQSEQRLNDIPQTPIANFMAASHALLLWNFHYLERPNLDEEMTLAMWPIAFSSSATTKTQHTYEQYNN
jgi:hypothetical protein